MSAAAPPGPSVSIVTLGCGRNEVDSDQLAGLLTSAGASVLDDPSAAEVVLVNTCTFIAPAKQESIDTVLEACQLKDDGSTRVVLVVGCMAQRYPHELADAVPEADAIVGFDGYGDLPRIVDDALAGRLADRVVGVGPAHPGARPLGRDLPLVELAPGGASPADGAASPVDGAASPVDGAASPSNGVGTSQDLLDRIPPSGPAFVIRAHDGRPWAYLKIASGCDRVCTFCAIPSFRGRFRSRGIDELVAEARSLADRGARELVLVSENTTSWGKDLPGGRGLQPELLRRLSAVEGIERLRLMYLQPAELTDELVEAIVAEPKVADYFDLSLQHVSGPIVARMARSGDHERFGRLIERIRSLAPHAVFRSNFILGFPGETDADVARLEDFLAAHRLDWVGLFAFSAEDGTPAHDFDDQVPAEVAHWRVQRVSELQEQIADEAARGFVGRDLEVIVQRDEHTTLARSYREAPDTDGEITLVGPGGTGGTDGTGATHATHATHGTDATNNLSLPEGRLLTAHVVDAVGVDLVARVDVATAGGAP